MDRQLLNRVEDNLWNVLGNYANGLKSPADVETVKHALSGIFKIKCLEGMDNYSNVSFRGNRSYDNDRNRIYYDEGSFRGGMSRDGRGSYGESYGTPHRDNYGGSYGGSYDTDMKQKLENLMRETKDEHQRQVIQEMVNKL